MLLPALELFHEEVVSLRDLGDFCIHSTLEVDVVLPSFDSITRVLIALSNNLVKMSHRDLGHQRLLDGTTKDGLDAGVAAL